MHGTGTAMQNEPTQLELNSSITATNNNAAAVNKMESTADFASAIFVLD